MYRVILHAEAWSGDRQDNLVLEMDLPFVPFVGLAFDLMEWNSSGNLSKRMELEFVRQRVPPDEFDTPDSYDVGKVTWNVHQKAFECWCEDDVQGRCGIYRCKCESRQDLDEHVRWLGVAGFKKLDRP